MTYPLEAGASINPMGIQAFEALKAAPSSTFKK